MTQRLSENQGEAILARAIELNARNPTTAVDAPRAIASDIGVSPTSFEAALREHGGVGQSRRAIAGIRASTVVAGLGVPLGLAAGALLAATSSSTGTTSTAARRH